MMGHAHLSTTATYLDELEQPGREEYGRIRAGVLHEDDEGEKTPEEDVLEEHGAGDGA